MGYKGTFSWINSLHQGGRKAISFTLKNTNLLQTATFDAAIVDGSNTIPTRFFRGQRLRAGQSATYDIENGTWDWAQSDFFCILDDHGRQIPSLKWELKLPEPAPGECPECHGSHQCVYCGGKGKILNPQAHSYMPCTVCRSTGICQTCFIPTRQNSPDSPTYAPQSSQGINNDLKKVAQIEVRIRELEHKIYLLEQNNISLQRNGMDLRLKTVYNSNLQLIHQYTTEILKLQHLISSI